MAVAQREMKFPCQPLVSGQDFAGEVQRNCGRDRAQDARGAHFSIGLAGLAQKWRVLIAKHRDFVHVQLPGATGVARGRR
ncbi:hypothetical protein CO656_05200 [Sinorhizobium sp. FG01]|uniref:Uncharacterized protein n=1 Tax=Sinorhizobium americanum TaxID=194963 RepID=A0A2S3YPT5_9HYPH|nr:hypothetical protein CO656_05200 [Sinorhizobium sp. FG01]POH32946.1 hypothetical protein ATY31_13810 [Sinorhizobium americanum]